MAMVLATRSTTTTTLRTLTPSMITGGVMPRKNHLLYLAVAALAAAASLPVCGGRAEGEAEAEEAAQRPVRRGSLRFNTARSGVDLGTTAPTRHGSLAFKFEPQDDLNSTHELHSMMDEKLKHMDPSVQCNDNTMSLKVKRVSAMHFLVDNGEKPLTPLAQMPSKCGFSMKRSRRDVQFAASYQGCHVTQQGGEYILPLRLWGTPITMSCPVMLPSPSVFCFPSGMVVKLGGITANDLSVKVSDTWKALSSASISCGFIVEVFPGGLTLTAPYNRGLCIEMKENEYLLTLLWTDVELFVTCPSVPNIKPTVAPVTLPSDTGQALLHPLYPHLPLFPEYPVLTPTHTPAPALQTMAPLPHLPLLSVPAAKTDTGNLQMPSAEHPAFSLMPQYPQYVLFPRPGPPTLSSASKNAASSQAQLPQLLPPSQYLYSILPQYPHLPGTYQPKTTAPPPVTTKAAPGTSPAPSSEHEGKPDPLQGLQLPYQFLSFLKHPSHPKDQKQAAEVPTPMIQPEQLPHVYPQPYQYPMLYPDKYFSLQQIAPTASPTTTTTTTATTTQAPAAPKPSYHPHPFMQVYYLPQQAAMPVYPDLPATPPTNRAPSDQSEHQSVSREMPPLYPFFSHQKPKPATRAW